MSAALSIEQLRVPPNKVPGIDWYLGFELDHGWRRITYRGVYRILNDQEYCLLALLMSQPGRVIPLDVIYDRIWPDKRYRPGTMPEAMRTKLYMIRCKMQEIGAPVEIITVQKVGLGLQGK